MSVNAGWYKLRQDEFWAHLLPLIGVGLSVPEIITARISHSLTFLTFDATTPLFALQYSTTNNCQFMN